MFIDLKNIKCFEELMTKQWYEIHVPFKLIMLKVHVACTWVFPQQVRQKIESIFYFKMYIYTLYFYVEVGNTLFNTLKFVSEFFK